MQIASWKSFLCMAAFGAVLGVLTSLTTAIGVTATLIGLLFTFVGTSLVSWFKPDALKVDERPAMVFLIGSFSTGILLGLATGFGLRLWEEASIRPWLWDIWDKQTSEVRAGFKNLQVQLQGAKGKDGKPVIDAKDVADALKEIEKLLEKQVSSPKPDSPVKLPPRPVFQIQSAEDSRAALQEINDALKADDNLPQDDKKKLTKDERENLKSLAEALEKTKPEDHLAPRVKEQVEKIVEGDKLPEKAREAIKQLFKKS